MSDDLVKDALKKFEASQEGSDHNRDDYYTDTTFARMGEQWPDAVKKQRVQEGRPHLVINKLPSLIRSIVNESRQNKPAIKVSPVDNGADEDTAEVIGGLIRSIERQSSAQVAYSTAIDNAVTGGMGFFRIEIDYAHEQTFDLEARIKRIPNALTVHYDTTSTDFDASDWDYAFISDMLSKDEFERRFPEASLTPFESDSRDVSSDHWISSNDEIRVAEYFKREAKTRKLLKFKYINPQTGQPEIQSITEEDLPQMARQFFEAGGMTVDSKDKDVVNAFIAAVNAEIVDSRDVEYFKVTKHLLNGVEELEDEQEWPGQRIPICPVWGDEIFIDGRRHFRSLIRDVKDSQQMYNFWRSATTELVALAPKAPWVGEQGFVPPGHESKWASANTRSHAYLEYTAGSTPPQRQVFAGVPAGALQEALNASEDMKSITGIFDASIGAKSNETSGKAILARERQGDVSNYHFIDNLSRAIRYCGQILVEIIPHVYNERESIRILGLDQKDNVVKLGQQSGSQNDGKLYDLSVGKYDVTVSTGPTFGTQREETREALIEIMRQVPDAAAYLGDVLLDHMDFVGADKIAKRLQHLLPPEVQEMEKQEIDKSENPEAAALEQQLQAIQQQAQQREQEIIGELQKIQQENEALKIDRQLEVQKLQSSAQLEAKKIQTQSEIKVRELQIKEGELQLKQAELALKQESSQQNQWDYDKLLQSDKQAFEADQNERDRQVDLAKTIIAKKDDGESEVAGVEEPDIAGAAMVEAVQILSAPKRVVRDANGSIIGVDTVVGV